ncbi:MAG TPA: hypothetical protein VL463_03650 [Kofleriaceae bacterium]|nr:hypothetical protein [Kofleriaceae bacterium]
MRRFVLATALLFAACGGKAKPATGTTEGSSTVTHDDDHDKATDEKVKDDDKDSKTDEAAQDGDKDGDHDDDDDESPAK